MVRAIRGTGRRSRNKKNKLLTSNSGYQKLNVRNIVESLSPEKMPIAPVEGKRSREASEVSGIPCLMEADR